MKSSRWYLLFSFLILFGFFGGYLGLTGCNSKPSGDTSQGSDSDATTPPGDSGIVATGESEGPAGPPPGSCRDGVLDRAAGEQCEEGSCCENCRLKPEGTGCDDGRSETREDRCNALGVCSGVLFCGNGACDSGETHASCAGDCPERAADIAAEGPRTTPPVETGFGTCGIWVTPTGNDSTADGSLARAFATPAEGLRRAHAESKILCLEVGTYSLGATTLLLQNGDKVFGSFVYLEGAMRFDHSSLLSREGSILKNDGQSPVVEIAPDASDRTVMGGLHLQQDPTSTHYTDKPLLLVTGGSPKIMMNFFNVQPVPVIVSEELYKRIAVEINASHASVNDLLFEENLVWVDQNSAKFGANIGVNIQNRGPSPMLRLTLHKNIIFIGPASMLTAGVLGYAQDMELNLVATVTKNRIMVADASRPEEEIEVRGPYRIKRPGGNAVGIGLGLYFPEFERLPGSFRRQNVFHHRYFSRADIRDNYIAGNPTAPSQQTYGIALTQSMDPNPSLVVNNFVVPGMARYLSAAFRSGKAKARLLNNILVGGGVTLPRQWLLLRLPGTDSPPADSAEYLTDARSCAVYIRDFFRGEEFGDIRNNILSSRVAPSTGPLLLMPSEHDALCFIPGVPVTEIRHNIFDPVLSYAFYQYMTAGRTGERFWNYATLVAEIDTVVGTLDRVPYFRDNLNLDPKLFYRDVLFGLARDSPAIDAAPCLVEVPRDRLDHPRPLGARCDIGSEEVNPDPRGERVIPVIEE